jgi:hypothetical protein
MCDPISLIGAALSVGGGLVNGMQQQSYVKAQNRSQEEAYMRSRQARIQEQARQAEFEKQQFAQHDRALEGLQSDVQKENLDQEAAAFLQRTDQLSDALPDGQLLSGQESANDDVKADIAKHTATTAADTRRRIAALAKLTSYGNVETGNNMLLQDTNNRIETTQGLRRGSLGVSQQEQTIPAAQVSPPNTMLGDIMSGVGALGVRAGGQGIGGFKTTAAPVAAGQFEWPTTFVGAGGKPLY